MPTPHPDPIATPTTLQEVLPVVTRHDEPVSSDDNPTQLDTRPLSPQPVNLTPQQSSSLTHHTSDHEAKEQDHVRTHAAWYNLRENPKSRINREYFMLELSNEPAPTKYLLA